MVVAEKVEQYEKTIVSVSTGMCSHVQSCESCSRASREVCAVVLQSWCSCRAVVGVALSRELCRSCDELDAMFVSHIIALSHILFFTFAIWWTHFHCDNVLAPTRHANNTYMYMHKPTCMLIITRGLGPNQTCQVVSCCWHTCTNKHICWL
jgi:hypothetical protein